MLLQSKYSLQQNRLRRGKEAVRRYFLILAHHAEEPVSGFYLLVYVIGRLIARNLCHGGFRGPMVLGANSLVDYRTETVCV